MARQKSEDKRSAILVAAVRLLARQGTSAPTAAIARQAGIANGSLFTYFETKSHLYNELYIELKSEMASAALGGLSPKAPLRKRLLQAWSSWTRWALENPDKRRVLALLGTSDELTAATRGAGHATMAPFVVLMELARADGPMRKAPLGLVFALTNAAVEATMDFMVSDPAHAEQHCMTGFEAVWRMLR